MEGSAQFVPVSVGRAALSPPGTLLGAIARKGNLLVKKNALRRCDAKHHRRLEGKPPYGYISYYTDTRFPQHLYFGIMY